MTQDAAKDETAHCSFPKNDNDEENKSKPQAMHICAYPIENFRIMLTPFVNLTLRTVDLVATIFSHKAKSPTKEHNRHLKYSKTPL